MAFWCLRRHASSRAGQVLSGALLVAAIVFAGPAWARTGGDTVRIVYPDSLMRVMQHDIVPAFEQATGYRVVGQQARSAKLASEVRGKAKAYAADVLITDSPAVNLELMGSSHDAGVDWYAAFMQSPLVLGYDQQSKFANELKSRPWYEVAAEADFRLGLTNPYEDAKGRLTAKAINRVVTIHGQHNLEVKLAANSQVVPVHDLIHRLQSHELDAAFVYRSEAAAAGIPVVPLNLGSIGATYTVTVLDNAPHPRAASAFVAFLLGREGKQIIKESRGLVFMPATPVFGNVRAVPAALKPILGAR